MLILIIALTDYGNDESGGFGVRRYCWYWDWWCSGGRVGGVVVVVAGRWLRGWWSVVVMVGGE